MTNKCTIISQIITLLHVSTNHILAKLEDQLKYGIQAILTIRFFFFPL